jgi:hypothetical protein
MHDKGVARSNKSMLHLRAFSTDPMCFEKAGRWTLTRF